LINLLLVVLLALVACGGAPETAAPVQEEAPLAALEESPVVEEPVVEEVVVEEAPAVVADAEFDLIANINDDYLSVIPEGFYAVGQIDAFKEIMAAGDVVLIDVREESEYAEGHIDGAVNVPLRTLTDNLAMIPMDQPVMVYCASGHRAAMATSALHMLGYENVRAFGPGWKGWTAAEEPVSTEVFEGESYAVPEIEPELIAAVDQFVNNIPEGFLLVKTVEDLTAALDAGAFLVDLRQPEEFAEASIPGAVNIPLRELFSRLDELPADQPIIVHCASGHRAALGLTALQTVGYTNVRSFSPGIKGWLAAQETTAEVPTFDVVAATDVYLSAMPDGYMVIKDVDSFNGIMDSGQAVLIDVREEAEYAEGHIPNAINIPLRTLTENLAAIPTDMPVVVYCASGHRAAMATSALHMLGYSNVRTFAPGWKGWTAAEQVVSTDPFVGETYTIGNFDPLYLTAVNDFVANIPEGWLVIKTADDVTALLDTGAFVLDVRQPAEFAEGHIPGAVNIPIRELAQNLDQLPTDVPIVVYCASGHRAALSIASLQVMGFDNVRSFSAGWKGWTEAGGEIETG
ncbi:MAG: rhodanese-like domain-containing protein, partial [Anaerolineales bacterium]|nr:rhodanese-like domain-containing protein [Anaerolineales bacterium]